MGIKRLSSHSKSICRYFCVVLNYPDIRDVPYAVLSLIFRFKTTVDYVTKNISIIITIYLKEKNAFNFNHQMT